MLSSLISTKIDLNELKNHLLSA